MEGEFFFFEFKSAVKEFIIKVYTSPITCLSGRVGLDMSHNRKQGRRRVCYSKNTGTSKMSIVALPRDFVTDQKTLKF